MNDRAQCVVVGMSGGVDSAVTAALLKQKGYEVHGAFLCMGGAVSEDRASRSCCTPRDAIDAHRSAEQLDIPLRILSVENGMRTIIDYFVREYQRGRTPNPCPLCNTDVKIVALLEMAEEIGATHIATGHYADIRVSSNRVSLHRAHCANKDQSYVLFALSPTVLQRLLLPLGQMPSKQAVREMGAKFGLDVRDKPDSQDVCFVPAGGHTELLTRHDGPGLLPGPVCDTSGRLLGTHKGYARYTIGQRRGIGIAARCPLYVIHIDPEENLLVLGPKNDLRVRQIEIRDAVWQQPVLHSFQAAAQLRYHELIVPAHVTMSDDTRTCHLTFDEPAECAVPGQAAVLYKGDRVLGGGWIHAVERVATTDFQTAYAKKDVP